MWLARRGAGCYHSEEKRSKDGASSTGLDSTLTSVIGHALTRVDPVKDESDSLGVPSTHDELTLAPKTCRSWTITEGE
jgi:hypothetical protein